MISEKVLDYLICPACGGGVSEEGEVVLCKGCGRSYPVRNGIPVMLVEEGTPEAERESGGE